MKTTKENMYSREEIKELKETYRDGTEQRSRGWYPMK